MNTKNIKRWIVLLFLIILNVFLVYRYLFLEKRFTKIRKVRYEEKGYGYTNDELNKLAAEYDIAKEQSLRLEFWVLVFFFILVVYSLYVLIKSK